MPGPTDLSIAVTAASEVSYAMAYNRVPVVDRIEITGTGPGHVAVVHVWLAGPVGPLSDRLEQVVELGAAVVLVDLPLRLDPAVLAVAEHSEGEIVVQVQDGNAVLARSSRPVRILPGSQWSAGDAGPTPLAVELLAAFVRPQDPALDAIAGAADERVQRLTGSPNPATDNDSDAGRVDALAAAVFDAIAAVGPQPLGEPDGWSVTGRVLAAPGDVLAAGYGGHLERALLLAAAFERAGLAPLIWLTYDGALTGYWREPMALAAAATTEVETPANFVDLSLMRVLVPDFGLSFTDAVAAAVDAVADADADADRPVLAVLDVMAARRDGIRALPVRTGDVVIEAAAAVVGPEPAPLRSDPAGDAAGGVPPRVAQWKNRLLDLSLRNRLINFSDRGAIALQVPVGQLGALEDVVNDGDAITLLPSDRISAVQTEQGLRTGRELPAEVVTDVFETGRAIYTDIPTAAYGDRLRGLAYKARTAVEETGANNLFLTLGMLSWSLDGRTLRSPLVLLPVRLVARNRGREYRLELDDAGVSTPNYCLLEKLRQSVGVTIPGLAEPLEDGSGIDLAAAVHAVRVEIARAGLPYRVDETAHLAVLAFAKYRLWRDLDLHWSDLADNALVRHLIESPTEAFVDPVPQPAVIDLDDLAARCPVPADSSQLGAVAAAVAGRTFVLEGPPGTGKSQTITNVLAQAVADGARVLFVAEKRAALDVVMRRLAAIGLGPLSLDLHDKGSRPTTVRAQLRAALDAAVSDDPQGLAVAAEQRRSAVGRLAAYARDVHEPNGSGLSYYGAATTLLAQGAGPALPVPTAAVEQPGVAAAARQALTTLVDVADPAAPRPGHPWGWLDPADPDDVDPAAVRAAALDVDAAVRVEVRGPAGTALAKARTFRDLAALATFASTWAQNLALLDEVGTAAWARAAHAVQTQVRAFVDAPHPELAVVAPQAMSLDVDELHARALAAAGSSWFGRRRRMQDVITDLAGVLHGPIERDHLVETTAGLVELRRNIRELADRATMLPGIDLPPDWNPLLPQGRDLLDRQFAWYQWASASVRAGGPTATPFTVALREFVAAGAHGTGADRDALQAMADAGSRLAPWTDDASVAAWSGEAGLIARWINSADERRLADPRSLVLQRWLALTGRLEPLRAAGAGTARAMLLRGEISADDAAAAWDSGVALTSLDERADTHRLDAFDPVAHGRTIARFTTATAALRDQLVSAIPAAAVRDRTFDSGSVLGQIGELRRELAKQRRGLSVRGLMTRYGDLITAITPCVLVSPDSLARFFPPRPGQFDLVIFDEASQIRVPDGIGAMGRARGVVVVGDSRQLPPTSFAESGHDDDVVGTTNGLDGLDGLAIPDEESILSECVQARLPQLWLSWHYRSVDETLISFSNRLYYEGRLSSFPAPTSGIPAPGPDGHGICLVRVPGEFLRSGAGRLLRTNPVEATAVVNEIRSRFDGSPDDVPSVGVVTFNAQQRTHIESMLRDLADERITAALERTDGAGLFVKNLENVQGDERDVILFSTAFSANSRGLLPLNFGPLNRSGGERRLNVAVTRARRQVIVFSSFDPEDLRAEETSSLGVKHLRAYLDLAAAGTRAAAAPVDPDRPWTPPTTGVRLAARPLDRHRDEIAVALRATGLGVRTDVGLSEFTIDLVVSPDQAQGTQPVMAVLLDGPAWAARRTVGDRDGLPVDVLSGQLEWPVVERVWLPEWRADPDGVVERLTQRLLEVVTPLAPGPEADPEPDDEGRPLPAAGPLPVAEPGAEPMAFRAWAPVTFGPREVLDRLHSQDGVHQVWQVLVDVIDTEGPVHHRRLAALAGAAFGWSRLTPGRREAILGCLPPGLPIDPDGEPFAWPLDLDPFVWTEFRRSSTDVRDLDEISLTELGNAAAALVRAAAGMHIDQLRLEVLRCFGFARRTTERDRRVDAAVAVAVDRGRVARDADLISPASAPG